MEMFANLWFFAYVIVAAVPAILMGIGEKPYRKQYILLVTLIFVFLSMRDKPSALIFLGIYCIWQWVLVKGFLYLRTKYDRKSELYVSAVILAIMPLALHKVGGVVHLSVFGFLGISYLTFKSVQMVIEIYDGIIKEMKTLDFFNFLLFFPSITSGPIDRSRRYMEDIDAPLDRKTYLERVGMGLFNILVGILYKFVIGNTVYQGLLWFGQGTDLKAALIYMYCYGIYLFFDFAGYSKMAIGVANLFGIDLPANFNKPFVSKDIKEFWDRWHMSLSYWFRDFLFSRFMMQSIRNKWFKTRVQAASVGFIINMTVMGIWHGLEIYYIMYGSYHGLLLAGTEIYQKKSAFHKKYKKERWYTLTSWFITFNLIMFGFFLFSGRFTKLVFGI